ncbi:hypothetical protein AYI69_g8877 [Smittium culicis]|uniref:Uncharacterized protein n=1 Tax=Smittium culicis TaxID=133412 RepID=A0A1R1XGG1_9FUNG|nr:hypothetical protein AYI69_g8877 [Smittium culicis]
MNFDNLSNVAGDMFGQGGKSSENSGGSMLTNLASNVMGNDDDSKQSEGNGFASEAMNMLGGSENKSGSSGGILNSMIESNPEALKMKLNMDIMETLTGNDGKRLEHAKDAAKDFIKLQRS